MSHPTRAEWEAYLADETGPADAARLEAHHAGCPACRAVVADLTRSAAPPAPAQAPSAEVASLLRRARIADAARAAGGSIDGYEVVEQIGRGGMGVVYRVRDRGAGRDLALKTLLPGVRAHPEARERFAREIDLLRANAGEGVVPVVADGEADGAQYVVLELAAGGSLADRLADFRDAPLELARVLAGAARTLDRLHRSGLVHRDIKPGNILLGYLPDDPAAPPPPPPLPLDRLEPLLADFGLITEAPAEAGAGAQLTGSRAFLGTCDHIAPEQAKDPRAADARSDVFALGTVLYAALTGRPPFEAATLYDAFRRLDRDEPIRPSSLNERAAGGLQRIALRCLEKDPAKRYPTAAALAADLDRFRAGAKLGPGTASYSRGMLFRRWCARHPAVSVPVAAAALLLIATAGVSIRSAVREAALRAEAEAQRDQAVAAVQDLISQAEAIGPMQKGNPEVRALLDRVRGRIAAFAGARDRPADHGPAADLHRSCGRIAFKLGDLPGAARDYDTALPLAEAALAADPANPAERLRTAKILREWGVTRAVQGKFGEATPAWDRAAALLDPIPADGADYRFTLSQVHMVQANLLTGAEQRARYAAAEREIDGLLADVPDEPKYRFLLAEVLNNQVYLAAGAAGEKEARCRRAVALRRQLVADLPGRADQMAYLAASLNHLGNALQATGVNGFAEAEATYKEARTIYEALVLVLPGVASNLHELRQVEANQKALADKRGVARNPEAVKN